MIPESIIDFINDQTCSTVCCVDKEDDPYCFSCFYAFDPEEGSIYFKSSSDTLHAQALRENHFVAGTIQPDKLNSLMVKGIQFRGLAMSPEHPLARKGTSKYYLKFPLALAMPGEVWTIRLSHIKMTDNTLAWGKKIQWTRAEEKHHAA
jgi:uncharacterized protein YhbP (UPF0306 family)